MEDIIIYGSGGMAKEVVDLIESINAVKPLWNIKGFLDDTKEDSSEIINGYKVLGSGEKLNEFTEPVNIVIAVSNPKSKNAIYNKIKHHNLKFPTLIHPSAKVSKSASIGEGSIVSADCIISVNVCLGKHVFLNMRTVLGHDVVVENFCSCLVNCIVAGNVRIKESCLLGSGCIIMEKICIGENAKVGMGSLVCFDVLANHTIMNRPSKSFFLGEIT